MASSTLALYDPQFNYIPPLPYAESGYTGSHGNGYGDFLPFFNTSCSSYFSLEHPTLDKDQVSDGLAFAAHSEEESDYWGRFLGSNLQSEYYEGEELQYDSHENWPTGTGFVQCWQDSFFSVGNDLTDDNGHGGGSREIEESWHQSEEQQSESYYKEEEAYTPYANEPLPGYWSWFESQWEEYTQDHNSWQEPRPSANELALCESIFGYWPCMSKDEQHI